MTDKNYTAAGRIATGLSYPVVARYNAPGGLDSYTDGRVLGRLVGYSTNITTADGNKFYADNAVAENASDVFASGTLELEIDGLLPETERFIYGLADPESVTVDGEQFLVSGVGVNSASLTLGVGVIVEFRCNNVVSYAPAIFAKATFRQGGDSAKTRGENVEWQSRTLSADLARDDTAKKMWKYNIENYYTDENAARAALRKIMKVPADG